MFNVWEYGRKKVTNLRASMRTNRPLSRSQSQSQLNDDEDKSGEASPSDETNPFSSATLPRPSSSASTSATTSTSTTVRPGSPTASTTSSSSRAAEAPARPSTRPPKRNSSVSTSSGTVDAAADSMMTPGAAATSPPTLPATRVKSPAPAIPTSAASAPPPSLPPPSLPPPTPSPQTPSLSRSDEDPIQASVLSRVSNKFGPAVRRKELLHLTSPPPAGGAVGGAAAALSSSSSSSPGTPSSARGDSSTSADNAASSNVVAESSEEGLATQGDRNNSNNSISNNNSNNGSSISRSSESSSRSAAAAALAADARIRREATAAAAAAVVPIPNPPSSPAISRSASSTTSASTAANTSASAAATTSGSAAAANMTPSTNTPFVPKPTLPSRMNSMRRRSQQGQADEHTGSGVIGAFSSGENNRGDAAVVDVGNDKNLKSADKNSNSKDKKVCCEKCGKELDKGKKGQCGSCDKKEQKEQKKQNRESKGGLFPEEDPTNSANSSTPKYGMCPRPGCRTLTHPSWRFCCTCSKNLKPFEILGTLAHMDILGKAANAVVKGGGFPEDPTKLQQKLDSSSQSKPEQRSAEDIQNAEELIKSVINGNVVKVVNLMLKGVSADTLDPDGISALNYACWHDRLDVVRVLCSFDADLNQRDARGVTALHVACNRSNGEELPGYLVKHGADVLVRGDNGESILHHAAAGGNMDGITFAIRNGVEVNDVDNDGATPLSYAIVCDNVDTLEYLLSNGASLNTKCHKGQTILHRAVQYRKMSSLKFAVEEGLKILDRDNESRNALSIANISNAPAKIISFLREALKNELERCSFCEDLPAHIQFLPCGHQYSCTDCCSRWKKCKCGEVIDKKVDVITDDKGESGAIQEDEVKRIEFELSRLQMERERFNEEKTCAVCMDRQKAIVFDCGHTTCEECSIKMRLCHTCRKPIAKKIKFY